METFLLSKPPSGSSRIPSGTLALVSRQLRNELHHIVLLAFKESGMSQAEVAARLGADKAQVSRQLGAPGNWTIDTAAKLLFAINGHVWSLATEDPDSRNLANFTQPDWLGTSLPSGSSPVAKSATIIHAIPHSGAGPSAAGQQTPKSAAPNVRVRHGV